MELHNPNHWIYVLDHDYTLNIVCGTRTFQTTLTGQGLLKFKEDCVIKQNEVTISSHNPKTNSITRAFVPSIHLNISELRDHVMKQEGQQETHHLSIRNNTEDINTLKQTIQQLREQEHISHDIQTPIHHLSIGYIALLTAISIIIYKVVIIIIKRKQVTTYDPPRPAQGNPNFELPSLQTTSS